MVVRAERVRVDIGTRYLVKRECPALRVRDVFAGVWDLLEDYGGRSHAQRG